MFSSRFFRRIFLPYLLLICTATAAVGAFVALRVRQNYVDRTKQAMRQDALLISDLLREQLQRGDTAGIEAASRQLGARLNHRVTIVENDGRVMGDDEADPGHTENHRQRPEIVQADASPDGDGFDQRSSGSIGQSQLFWAHKLTTADGKVHFVRLSLHADTLNQQLHLVYAPLAMVVLVAIVAAGVMSFYLARRSTVPVLELTNFAQALAEGQLNRRLLLAGDDEISDLAGALNVMANSLGRLLEQNRKDRAELLAMLASMSEGVIATDTRQRIVVVNQRAGELLAFPTDQTQGKPLWEIVRDEAILKAVREVLETGERKAF
ncbi:MAG TPA: HAMP domain-containing protein, partial [Tepidisphaeraceae bacterium]|nr:HAMP domain-containing protein [Tepidisphaeraceae bacterium]